MNFDELHDPTRRARDGDDGRPSPARRPPDPQAAEGARRPPAALPRRRCGVVEPDGARRDQATATGRPRGAGDAPGRDGRPSSSPDPPPGPRDDADRGARPPRRVDDQAPHDGGAVDSTRRRPTRVTDGRRRSAPTGTPCVIAANWRRRLVPTTAPTRGPPRRGRAERGRQRRRDAPTGGTFVSTCCEPIRRRRGRGPARRRTTIWGTGTGSHISADGHAIAGSVDATGLVGHRVDGGVGRREPTFGDGAGKYGSVRARCGSTTTRIARGGAAPGGRRATSSALMTVDAAPDLRRRWRLRALRRRRWPGRALAAASAGVGDDGSILVFQRAGDAGEGATSLSAVRPGGRSRRPAR